MLHATKLDDVGPTCWLRLNRPVILNNSISFIVLPRNNFGSATEENLNQNHSRQDVETQRVYNER